MELKKELINLCLDGIIKNNAIYILNDGIYATNGRILYYFKSEFKNQYVIDNKNLEKLKKAKSITINEMPDCLKIVYQISKKEYDTIEILKYEIINRPDFERLLSKKGYNKRIEINVTNLKDCFETIEFDYFCKKEIYRVDNEAFYRKNEISKSIVHSDIDFMLNIKYINTVSKLLNKEYLIIDAISMLEAFKIIDGDTTVLLMPMRF
jgi:hypothetical protein